MRHTYLTLLHVSLSVCCRFLMLFLSPMWFPSGRCQHCLTQIHHQSVSGMKASRMRHLQAMQCFSQDVVHWSFLIQGNTVGRAIPGREAQSSFTHAGSGNTTHHGRDLFPSYDSMPEVLHVGHQSLDDRFSTSSSIFIMLHIPCQKWLW